MIKQLSIAIPTVNRKDYLNITIQHFLPQIERNVDRVELVISDNFSVDGTSEYFKDLAHTKKNIKYVRTTSHLPLFDSFSRAVSESAGKYVILWGDDDIPAPYFVESILNVIDSYTNTQLIHFNRLIGYNNKLDMRSLKLCQNTYENSINLFEKLSDINEKYFYDITFMSSVVFLREAWNKGLKVDTSSHYGFEFMGSIFYGIDSGYLIYIPYPLCIQRKPLTRLWFCDWPLYGLIGIPNMVKDFERDGLYDNGLKIWNKKYNRFFAYVYILICAAVDKKKYKPYCKSICLFQDSIIRKLLCYLIIYCCPKWMFSIIRKIQFKLK